jgi:hypothetical protein
MWRHQNISDDGYITLTYAKNLARGNGFIYNHPPATLGTTTPLFTFLVASLALVLPFFTVAQVAILASTAAWIGTGWMLYVLTRKLAIAPIPAAVAAIIPLLTAQGWVMSLGMEMWPFQLLLVASICLAINHKPFWAGLCVWALTLTRGEGALLGVILFGVLWSTERRSLTRFVPGLAIPAVGWVMYSVSTFGVVVPNTLAAKQLQASSPLSFLNAMMTDLLPGLLDRYSVFGTWWLSPCIVLVGLGLQYAIRHKKPMGLFALWGVTYLAAYSLINPSPYPWYRLHVVFVIQVLVGCGLAWLVELVENSPGLHKRVLCGLGVLAVGALFLHPGLRFTILEASQHRGDFRAKTYREVSAWLREHTDPTESVAFAEIGYLGYFTDNRIIDLVGLIDPLITDHLATDGFAWGFWHYHPDYYLYAEDFNWLLGVIKPFDNGYVAVHEVARDYSAYPIIICKRVD